MRDTVRFWIARHLAPIKVTTYDIPVTIAPPAIVELIAETTAH